MLSLTPTTGFCIVVDSNTLSFIEWSIIMDKGKKSSNSIIKKFPDTKDVGKVKKEKVS